MNPALCGFKLPHEIKSTDTRVLYWNSSTGGVKTISNAHMVSGRGWIALALTAFATWRPLRILLGAYLFGSMTMLQLSLQAGGIQVPSQLLSMLPYLASIAVLVLISRNPVWIRTNMPASLGKPFSP